jgi:hypothetical protein
MEKVINEFRIIETDDGFRIEIKGDKEAIRQMLHGFGAGFPFGRGFRFGPGFWSGFGGWCGPWQEANSEKKRARTEST